MEMFVMFATFFTFWMIIWSPLFSVSLHGGWGYSDLTTVVCFMCNCNVFCVFLSIHMGGTWLNLIWYKVTSVQVYSWLIIIVYPDISTLEGCREQCWVWHMLFAHLCIQHFWNVKLMKNAELNPTLTKPSGSVWLLCPIVVTTLIFVLFWAIYPNLLS